MKRNILAALVAVMVGVCAEGQSVKVVTGGGGSAFNGGTVTSAITAPGYTLTETLGTERVTGTCAGWGLGAPVGAWSCSGTTITRTASGANLTITDAAATVTVGTTYKVTWTIATLTAGSFQLSVGGVALPARLAAGTYTTYITATATTAPVITAIATSAGTITSTVSIKPHTDGITQSADADLRFFGDDVRLYHNSSDGYFLLNVASSTAGDRFWIHNFSHPTGTSAVPDGYNIFIGANAGNFTTGGTATSTSAASFNIGIGQDALKLISTGAGNTCTGTSSCDALTTAGNNSGYGYNSLGSVADGGSNSGFGTSALTGVTSGTQNSGFGQGALQQVTTTSENSALGYFAGRYLADGSTVNSTPARGLFLGALTKSSAAGQTNETVVGYDAVGKGSNTAVIGDDNVTDVWASEDGGATLHGVPKVIDRGAKPTCDSTIRGMIWYDAGAGGVADTVEMCGKAAADTYSWVALATF